MHFTLVFMLDLVQYLYCNIYIYVIVLQVEHLFIYLVTYMRFVAIYHCFSVYSCIQ